MNATIIATLESFDTSPRSVHSAQVAHWYGHLFPTKMIYNNELYKSWSDKELEKELSRLIIIHDHLWDISTETSADYYLKLLESRIGFIFDLIEFRVTTRNDLKKTQ